MPLKLAKSCNDLLSFAEMRAGTSLLFWRGVSCRGARQKVLLLDPNAVKSGVAGENLQGELSTLNCYRLPVQSFKSS